MNLREASWSGKMIVGQRAVEELVDLLEEYRCDVEVGLTPVQETIYRLDITFHGTPHDMANLLMGLWNCIDEPPTFHAVDAHSFSEDGLVELHFISEWIPSTTEGKLLFKPSEDVLL